MVDAVIALELLTLETSHLRVRVGNRSVLRQVPVDDKLVAVRRRKELLRHELHADQREEKSSARYANGGPAMLHAHDKETGEPLCGSPLRLAMRFHLGRQDRNSEQWREQHGDDPRYDQGDSNHDEQGESKFTGVAA